MGHINIIQPTAKQSMLDLLFTNPIAFFGWFFAFLIAIMTHECMHSLAALHNGDPTAKYSGRMNFNPINHFDLTGLLMCVILGFGYAKPVPIDPRNFNNYKKGMLEVSLAGVLANLAIAFCAYPLFVLAVKYFPDIAQLDDLIIYFLLYLVYIDVWLMIFNLLPIYPLDGFRLIEIFFPRSSYCRFMRANSRYVFLIYILLTFLGSRFGINLNIVSFLGEYVFSGIAWIWGLIL